MVHVVKKILIVAMFLLCMPFMGEVDNQSFVDSLIRSILVQQPIEYIPLKGGSDAQISRVIIEPASYVLRRMSDKVSLERCIRESAITSMCSEQGIGPRVYVVDPVNKIIVSEYVPDQGVPRDQFGTQKFLYSFGSLIQKLHKLNVQDIENRGLTAFGASSHIDSCNLFTINKITEKIDNARNQLIAIEVSLEKLKELANYFTQKLTGAYTTHMVFSHGDLHWGNCLYAQGRMWLIDYETSGLAPWWYDLGVLGAHFSFLQESDDYLLEGYFDKNRNQIAIEEKMHYLCMKQIAKLYYALHRLAEFPIDTVQRANNARVGLSEIQKGYKDGTFSLGTEYEQAVLAIAMICSVLTV